jgi:hypothetical protein
VLSLTSLDEAAAVTSFVPALPDYIPDGYERVTLSYRWPGEIASASHHGFESKGPRAPFEQLSAEYVDANRDQITITQGYGASIAGLYEQAPDQWRGEIQFGDRHVYWYQGSPEYAFRDGPFGVRAQYPIEGSWDFESGYTVVYWQTRDVAPSTVSEIAQDGTTHIYEGGGYPLRGAAG